MNEPPFSPDEQNELESALEKGLRRPPLSPEALERVRLQVLAEYRRQTSVGSPRWRLRVWIAVAAMLGVLAVGALLFSSILLHDAVVARLESSSGSGVLMPEGSVQRRVEVGAELHTLERWNVRGSMRASLAAGGTIRMSEGTLLGARNPRSIVLSAGRAYFDFPKGSAPFVVHTSIGTVEHLGTQFEVTQSDRGVRVRVREGSVVLRGDRREVSIGEGMEIVVDPQGRIEQGSYPTYGDDWAWVEAMAPPYDIENRRLSDFLTWVARETGRQIAFVDPRAREVADRTTLHGSVQGLRPLEALDQVLNTTTLRFEIRGGEIRIAMRGPIA